MMLQLFKVGFIVAAGQLGAVVILGAIALLWQPVNLEHRADTKRLVRLPNTDLVVRVIESDYRKSFRIDVALADFLVALGLIATFKKSMEGSTGAISDLANQQQPP